MIETTVRQENIERLEGFLADPGLPAVCEYRAFLERRLDELRRGLP